MNRVPEQPGGSTASLTQAQVRVGKVQVNWKQLRAAGNSPSNTAMSKLCLITGNSQIPQRSMRNWAKAYL